MIKRIFSLMIMTLLSISHVHAEAVIGLKEIYDDFHYAITVEWDQKDPAFLKERRKEFFSKINELKAEGITQKDLIHFIKTNIKDERLLNDLEATFDLVESNNLSEEEIGRIMMDTMNRNYNRGASYISPEGENIAVYVTIGVLLAGALAFFIAMGATGGFNEINNEIDEEIDDGGYYPNCTTYYDEYGSYQICT